MKPRTGGGVFRKVVLSEVVTLCKGEPRVPSGSFSVMGVSQAGTGRMVETEVLGNGGVSKASRRRARIGVECEAETQQFRGCRGAGKQD